MANKKKDKEEQLARRRLAKRKRYAELKQNEELYAIEKEKERQRYIKRKEAKKIVSINEMTPRAQREQRKRWRQNKRKHLNRKKDEQKIAEVMLETDDKDAQKDEENSTVDPLSQQSYLVQEEKTKNMQDIVTLRDKTVIKLKLKIKKMQLARIKENKQYKIKYDSLVQENRKLRKIIQRRVRLDKTKINTVEKEENTNNKKFKEKVDKQVISLVRNFYTEDRNSNLAAGVKEYITKNKIKRQKRYLNDTLRNLYKLFLVENDNIRISYSFFCKCRPFWVVFPKNNRKTCQCLLHENNELLIKALNKAKILNIRNNQELLQSLCCDKYNVKCLDRRCDECKNRQLPYNKFNNDQNILFSEWLKTPDETTHKVMWNKKENSMNATELIRKLNDSIQKFMPHCANITAQYKEIKELKNNMENNVAVVHIDFSENYALKFHDEIQSFHFGGSRGQVSIHTVVIYLRDYETYEVKTYSFCSVSENLKHNASAVWAHLIPVLNYVNELSPFIDTIHFISDSPSSQYRNRFIYYILTQLHNDFVPLRLVSWNYLEAGHGKGAPDGLGAVLKRTADRIVNEGEDIGTFTKFVKVVQANIPNIRIVIVNSDDIVMKEKIMSATNIQPFKGFMKTHQVLFSNDHNQIAFRTRSCFSCLSTQYPCDHNKHLGFLKLSDESNKENQVNVKHRRHLKGNKHNMEVVIGTPSSVILKRKPFDQPSTSTREDAFENKTEVCTLQSLDQCSWENSCFMGIPTNNLLATVSNDDRKHFEEFIEGLLNEDTIVNKG